VLKDFEHSKMLKTQHIVVGIYITPGILLIPPQYMVVAISSKTPKIAYFAIIEAQYLVLGRRNETKRVEAIPKY